MQSPPNDEPRPEQSADDERELLVALRRGDDHAFEAVIRVHGRAVLACARRLLGNEEDARDCVQETLLAAFRSVGTFEGKSRQSTWLHRIAVNHALMRLRRRRARPELAIEDLLPRFLEDGHHADPPCPWSEAQTVALQTAESRRIVRDAIERLPAQHREVVMLRDLEGLSTEETAELLGITSNAAKIRLHRARQALRTLLDQRLEDLDP